MNVWELLTQNSTAPSGSTAWQHLNAQQSGPTTQIMVAAERDVDIISEFTVFLELPELSIDNTTILTCELTPIELTVSTSQTLELE